MWGEEDRTVLDSPNPRSEVPMLVLRRRLQSVLAMDNVDSKVRWGLFGKRREMSDLDKTRLSLSVGLTRKDGIGHSRSIKKQIGGRSFQRPSSPILMCSIFSRCRLLLLLSFRHWNSSHNVSVTCALLWKCFVNNATAVNAFFFSSKTRLKRFSSSITTDIVVVIVAVELFSEVNER